MTSLYVRTETALPVNLFADSFNFVYGRSNSGYKKTGYVPGQKLTSSVLDTVKAFSENDTVSASIFERTFLSPPNVLPTVRLIGFETEPGSDGALIEKALGFVAETMNANGGINTFVSTRVQRGCSALATLTISSPS
jgi:hypothetical protein